MSSFDQKAVVEMMRPSAWIVMTSIGEISTIFPSSRKVRTVNRKAAAGHGRAASGIVQDRIGMEKIGDLGSRTALDRGQVSGDGRECCLARELR